MTSAFVSDIGSATAASINLGDTTLEDYEEGVVTLGDLAEVKAYNGLSSK